MIRHAALVDVRRRARSRSSVVALVLLLVALGVAVEVSFRLLGDQPAPSIDYGYGLPGVSSLPGHLSPTEVSRPFSLLSTAGRGAVVLAVLSGVLSLLGSCLTAIVGASSIAGEYERETLDLLLTTELGAGGLLVEKLVGTVAYGAILCLAVLPAFGFVLVFSAVPLTSLLGTAAIVLGSLLIGATLGIFFSTLLRSSIAAVVCAVAAGLLLFLGGIAIYAVLFRAVGNLPLVSQLLLLPSPAVALVSVAQAAVHGTGTLGLPALLGVSPANPVLTAGHEQVSVPVWFLTIAMDSLLALMVFTASLRSLKRHQRLVAR